MAEPVFVFKVPPGLNNAQVLLRVVMEIVHGRVWNIYMEKTAREVLSLGLTARHRRWDDQVPAHHAGSNVAAGSVLRPVTMLCCPQGLLCYGQQYLSCVASLSIGPCDLARKLQ